MEIMDIKKEAMDVCKKKVRRIRSCKECLHYSKCEENIFNMSKLSQLIAYLDIVELPRIEKDLHGVFNNRIHLEAGVPYDGEIDAYAVIRIYRRVNHTNLVLARVGIDGIEAPADLKTLIFNAYVMRKGKAKHEHTKTK